MTVLIIISLLISGGVLGYLFQSHLKNIKVGTWLMYAVYVLLFVLGIYIGANETIVNNLHKLGGQALGLALGGIAGSVAGAYIVWRYREKINK